MPDRLRLTPPRLPVSASSALSAPRLAAPSGSFAGGYAGLPVQDASRPPGSGSTYTARRQATEQARRGNDADDFGDRIIYMERFFRLPPVLVNASRNLI